VPIGDDPVPVDDAAATLMTVNINVTATPDTLDAVLEQVRASGLAP
jgi:hypothetical protein